MKKKNFNLIIGYILTGIIVFFVLIGCFYTPYDPEMMDASQKLSDVSWAHWMGCDNFGRDILSRVMIGCRNTLFVATITVIIGAGIGTIIGAFTGYFGGLLDEISMRILDTIFAFSSILLALVMIAILGVGMKNVIIALGIAFIPSFARIVRSEFMHCRTLDYVKSARLAGASHLRIMFVHILPNIKSILFSAVMIGFNNAVLAEAGMSYLGIGVQPPDASLGSMLSEAQAYIFSTPTYAMFPGLVMIVMILGFSLLGEGYARD